MSNNGNIININKLMHSNTKLNVSPGAVRELSGRIVDKLHDLAPELDKIAIRHDRKTVMENDVIELFGYINVEILEVKDAE